MTNLRTESATAQSSGADPDGYEFTVTVTKSDAQRATVRLEGSLNRKSAAKLTACLEHQLGLGRRYGQLDLTGLDSIDSAGLDAIVGAHHAYLAQRGTLILTRASLAVRSFISHRDLDTVLLIGGPQAPPERQPA
jgi:anti-anti-sigma factor